MLPLNGTKTHPLTKHAIAQLHEIYMGPQPRHKVNPGCANRLLREALVESVHLPKLWPLSLGKKIEFLQITAAGRAALGINT